MIFPSCSHPAQASVNRLHHCAALIRGSDVPPPPPATPSSAGCMICSMPGDRGSWPALNGSKETLIFLISQSGISALLPAPCSRRSSPQHEHPQWASGTWGCTCRTKRSCGLEHPLWQPRSPKSPGIVGAAIFCTAPETAHMRWLTCRAPAAGQPSHAGPCRVHSPGIKTSARLTSASVLVLRHVIKLDSLFWGRTVGRFATTPSWLLLTGLTGCSHDPDKYCSA